MGNVLNVSGLELHMHEFSKILHISDKMTKVKKYKINIIAY